MTTHIVKPPDAVITKRGDLKLGPFELTRTGVRITGQPNLDEFLEVVRFVEFTNEGSPWWWGDLLRYAESRADWHERWAQALSSSGLKEEYLRNLKYVAENIAPSRRRDDVNFAVHSEAASLDASTQAKFLNKAAEEGWTVREARLNKRSFKRSGVHRSTVPTGKFRVVYADPPWSYANSGVITDADAYGRAERHYRSMDIPAICAFKVGDQSIEEIVEKNAVLCLWVTSPMLEECWPVITAWGFKYKTSMIWDKVAHNFGSYVSVRHELLLICTRGSCLPDRPTPMPDSVVTVKRSDVHSQKPEEFRQIIEKLYDGPYLELFGRGDATGWTVVGNQAASAVA